MSLLLTRMQNLRDAAPMYQSAEWRNGRWGALTAALRMTASPTGIVNPGLAEKALASIGRTLEIPVIDYDRNVTIGNVRTVTIPDDENTSRMIAVTFATFSWGFTMVPTNFINNEIGYQQDFNRKGQKYLDRFFDAVENLVLAKLDADKSLVLRDNLGKYAMTAGTVVVPDDRKDEFVGDLDVLQRGNDYYGVPTVIGTNSLDSHVRNRLIEKGMYNEVDKTYQYANKIWYFTNRMTDAAGKTSTGYILDGDAIGMLFRVEAEALMQTKTEVQGYQWDLDTVPGYPDMPLGLMYYQSVGDQSGLTGAASAHNTRAHKEHFGFSVDIAVLTPYISDRANEPSPILAFEVERPATA